MITDELIIRDRSSTKQAKAHQETLRMNSLEHIACKSLFISPIRAWTAKEIDHHLKHDTS